MTFKCKIGLHSWNGCKCSECEKTRDEQHDWSHDCEKCSKCGQMSEYKHDWSKDCEKCSKCGKARKNQHDWTHDCENCSKCGQERENQHDWTHDCEKCSKCGKASKNQHDWYGIKCRKCKIVNHSDFLTIHTAVSNNNIDFVRVLIDQGVDINIKNDEGLTPLYACRKNLRMTELLISAGANLNWKYFNGDTLLTWACTLVKISDLVEYAEFLILKGADINMKNDDGLTALMLASDAGQTQLVELLTSKNANIDAKDKKGKTALSWAFSPGHNLKIAELLILKGADLNCKVDIFETPLFFTIKYGYLEIAELLINKGAKLNIKDYDKITPLQHAYNLGYIGLIKHMLLKGIKLDALKLNSEKYQKLNLDLEDFLKPKRKLNNNDNCTVLCFPKSDARDNVFELFYTSNRFDHIEKRYANSDSVKYKHWIVINANVVYKDIENKFVKLAYIPYSYYDTKYVRVIEGSDEFDNITL